MTINQLVKARQMLDLTKSQMSNALGYSDFKSYNRLELGDRKINGRVAVLVKALLIIARTQHAHDFGLK